MDGTPRRDRLAIILAVVMLTTASAGTSCADDETAADQGARVQIQSVSFDRRILELEQRLADLDRASCPTGPCDDAGCGCTCNCCCPGWFASADYLNWEVERNDLAFAIRDPAGLGVPSGGQPVLSLDLGANGGFRTAIGRRTSTGWELGLRYTGLRADDSQTFAPGAGQVLAVLSSPSTGLTNADAVTATSRLRYDVFDLEAGYWLDGTESISVLLFGGVRLASIDHHLQSRYQGGAFVNGVIDVPTDLDAVGGRIGGALHWNVASGFSLFGGTSISVCATDVTTRRREVNAGAVIIDANRVTQPVMPVLDLSLGLRYSRGSWSVAAGYDWVNWFNAVSPLEFTDSFNGGTLAGAPRDLGLHGLFVNATLSY